ncbi:uncharacterized protein RJT21DRAFT_34976 [Scheffersomyces amazonensis]|uniref:uncharacterized protein n=1 Tax=Scheffersomyces amazonensis TaxID=1078765 RepID=UPI00315CBAC4
MSETLKKARVYIKNLHYSTTEDELEELLKPYEPTHVLIPSHTVRFSGISRPLGIAYAEFKDNEQVKKVIDQLNGITLKDRELYIKPHIPIENYRKHFGFKNRFYKRDHKKDSISVEESDVEKGKAANSDTNSTEAIESNPLKTIDEDDTADKLPESKESLAYSFVKKAKELSENTIYIPKANAKVTDQIIRDFLQDYCPGQVYIYRSKQKKASMSFIRDHVSVLATVDTSECSLSDIVSQLRGKKLLGKVSPLYIAYKSKIEEVQKAATVPKEVKESSEEVISTTGLSSINSAGETEIQFTNEVVDNTSTKEKESIDLEVEPPLKD